jgi:hypothetical protein
MGRRARKAFASNADSCVTILGVVGFLGFLVVARMDSPSASPFDYMAYAWFFTFGAIKMLLPRLLKLRAVAHRPQQQAGLHAVECERRWYCSM